MNDSSTSPVKSLDSIASHSAYVLFYELVNEPSYIPKPIKSSTIEEKKETKKTQSASASSDQKENVKKSEEKENEKKENEKKDKSSKKEHSKTTD